MSQNKRMVNPKPKNALDLPMQPRMKNTHMSPPDKLYRIATPMPGIAVSNEPKLTRKTLGGPSWARKLPVAIYELKAVYGVYMLAMAKRVSTVRT